MIAENKTADGEIWSWNKIIHLQCIQITDSWCICITPHRWHSICYMLLAVLYFKLIKISYYWWTIGIINNSGQTGSNRMLKWHISLTGIKTLKSNLTLLTSSDIQVYWLQWCTGVLQDAVTSLLGVATGVTRLKLSTREGNETLLLILLFSYSLSVLLSNRHHSFCTLKMSSVGRTRRSLLIS